MLYLQGQRSLFLGWRGTGFRLGLKSSVNWKVAYLLTVIRKTEWMSTQNTGIKLIQNNKGILEKMFLNNNNNNIPFIHCLIPSRWAAY